MRWKQSLLRHTNTLFVGWVTFAQSEPQGAAYGLPGSY